MDCPRNHEPLKEIEFEGVLVDICPSCGGVWFDPKELEKFDEAHEEAGQKLLELIWGQQTPASPLWTVKMQR